MIKKKGKFLTFLFSLVPGAGQMYLGFMKLGTSLMVLFAGIICLSSLLNLSAFIFLLPIVWCYAFFDAWNKNSLSDEEFYSLEDRYCISYETIAQIKKTFNGKERQVLSVALILIGVDILWENFFWLMEGVIPHFIWYRINNLIYRLPQLIIACIILYAGYVLIHNKKKDLFES